MFGNRGQLDLPGKSGEHQLRNQEVFYGKREQTDAGVSASATGEIGFRRSSFPFVVVFAAGLFVGLFAP